MQLFAVLRKNFLLKTRDWRTTLWEVLLPVLVITLLLIIRLQITKDEFPDELHLDKARVFRGEAGLSQLAFFARRINRVIAVAPENAFTQQLTQDLVAQHPSMAGLVQLFASESQLEDYVTDSRYAKRASFPGVWAAVIVDRVDHAERVYEYTLRLNATESGKLELPRMMPNTLQTSETDDLQVGYKSDSWTRYFEFGELALQHFMEGYLINASMASQGGRRTPEPVVLATPFPTPKHFEDDFAEQLGSFLGLFFTLVYIYPVTRIIKLIVEEKEQRIRELMRMMGLGASVTWVSWFITYAIIFAVSSLLITAISSTTLFELSDKFIIFIFFFLFSLSVFAFCYLMSAFFTRARVGSTFGAIIFLVIFFPYFTVAGGTSGEQTLGCLSAPLCFGLGATAIFELEAVQRGVQWDNMADPIDNTAISTVLVMLMVDIGLYMALALYFERTVKSTYGVPQPWYFPCIAIFRCLGCCGRESSKSNVRVGVAMADLANSRKGDHGGGEENEQRKNKRNRDTIQRRPFDQDKPPDVVVRHLRKEFDDGKVVAVKDMSLDMYEGEITALLGHNGAGKSVTVSCLSGLYEPTGGEATVYGHSVRDEMDQVHSTLGVCPQQNVLFDELTVREHFELYAHIKGVPAETMDEDIDTMISSVGIAEKTHERAATLSGGQKRKLHVGLALLGGSKFVILDEASSGVDAYSRRLMWNLLEKAKKDRVILLVTHFMEEAENLGDRIVIMGKGEKRAAGSALFLKSAYGVGYNLLVTKKNAEEARRKALKQAHEAVDRGEYDTVDDAFRAMEDDGDDAEQDIIDLVTKNVDDAALLNRSAGDISFRLPFESSKQFPDVLNQLDDMTENGPVDSWSLSVTTLEEVFLRVGKEDEEKDDREVAMAQQKRLQAEREVEEERRTSQREHGDADDGDDEQRKSEQSRKSRFDSMQPTASIDGGDPSVAQHVYALLVKRLHNAKRDRKVMTWTFLYPFLIMLAGVGLLKYGSSQSFPTVSASTKDFNTPVRVPFNNESVAMTGNGFDSLDLPTIMERGALYPGNSVGLPISGLGRDNTTAVRAMQEYLLATGFAPDAAFRQSRYGAFTVASENEVAVHFNTTAPSSLPVYVNLWNNILLRYEAAMAEGVSVSDPSVQGARIELTIDPLPLTADEETLQQSLTAVLISIAFAFVPASFAGWVVKERSSEVKHQQLIAGVSATAYWGSTYVWDMINYLVPSLLCIAVLFLYDVSALLGDALPATILAIVLFGFSVIPFTYVLSWLFDNESAAQNVMLLVNIFSGSILLIVSIVLDIIDSTKDVNKVLKFFYRLVPNYCFGEALVNLLVRSAAAIFGSEQGVWDLEISGWPMLYMALVGPLCFVLVLALEKDSVQLFFMRLMGRNEEVDDAEEDDAEEDDDVVAERKLVKSGEADDNAIVIDGLRKVFPGRNDQPAKVAVKGVSLAVPEGQCLGLLGPSGSGKTVMIRMLTGDMPPTSGTARLSGHDVVTAQQLVRQELGYCGQFDALIDTLTAVEHLEMYARIKGVAESDIPQLVQGIIEQLNLADFAEQPAGGYSGGNKRKLSVAIALIGNPRVVLLDEPSTGLDPISRRFMWDLISQTMRGRSVILTTHSLDEAQSLCSRIVILVDGSFRCMGSASHLKSKFGQGFQLEAICEADGVKQLVEFLRSKFPHEGGVSILERHARSIKLRLINKSEVEEIKEQGRNLDNEPGEEVSGVAEQDADGDGEYRLADLFAIIEEHREEMDIEEWSLSQTSLEQVFIQFAKQQEASKDMEANNKDMHAIEVRDGWDGEEEEEQVEEQVEEHMQDDAQKETAKEARE